MSRILVLFAHPMLEKSKTQKTFLEAIGKLNKVYVHDLYQVYPHFDIDVTFEQELLSKHDIIVFQHPFYWYSAPPLIKQWIDLVLEHGWAYGKDGNQLKGKWMFHAISTGGPQMAYQEGGFNQYTIRQFLAPFEQTARLCKMQFLPPFVMHATHKSGASEIQTFALNYRQLLEGLTQEMYDLGSLSSANYLNDLLPGKAMEA